MLYRHAVIIGALAAVTVGAGACRRDAAEPPKANAEVSRDADRAADLQRQRDEEINRLDQRVADVERKYAKANEKVVSGSRTATAGLREELQEDVHNIKQAVNDLKTTTPANWWDRQELAMKRTADDVEADVKRLAGSPLPQRPADATGTTGEGASTAPFTSRRDEFVASLRARVDAMEAALDKVKASGAREEARRRHRPPSLGVGGRLVGCEQGACDRLRRTGRRLGRPPGRQQEVGVLKHPGKPPYTPDDGSQNHEGLRPMAEGLRAV